MSFYYEVSWSEANVVRRELDDRYIPYDVATQLSGEVVFLFPDLTTRLYVRGREIFGDNGICSDQR